MKRIVLLLGALTVLAVGAVAQPAGAPVYVTLWFDAEDYILPQDDDATKRLAEMLTRLGRAGHVQSRRRKGARAGTARTARRDRRAEAPRYRLPLEHAQPAADRSRSICRTPAGRTDAPSSTAAKSRACGTSSASSASRRSPTGSRGARGRRRPIPALRDMGIRMYLDEADHVGIDDQPFYYGGMLNVFKMRSNLARMELSGGASLADGKARLHQVVRTAARAAAAARSASTTTRASGCTPSSGMA